LEYGPAPFMIAGVMFSLLAGALVLLISMYAELNRVKADHYRLLEFLGGGRPRDLLRELAAALDHIEADRDMTEREIAQLYSLVGNCIQKTAVVRYNAFHNVGSDQSYSIALLDSEDNGVVLSGIFGRDMSTTYAKPIIAGYSEYPLTDEEVKVIGIARKRFYDMTFYGNNQY